MDEHDTWSELKHSMACVVDQSGFWTALAAFAGWWWYLPNLLWPEPTTGGNVNLFSLKPDQALLSGTKTPSKIFDL